MMLHIFSHQDNKNSWTQGMKHWQLLGKVIFLFFSYFVNFISTRIIISSLVFLNNLSFLFLEIIKVYPRQKL